MTAALAWLRAHPRLGVFVLCAACALGGWFAHQPPAQTEHEKASEKETSASATQADSTSSGGAWTRETWEFAPMGGDEHSVDDVRRQGQPEGGARHVPYIPTPGSVTSSVAPAVPDTGQLLRLIVERHDPVTIATHETTQAQSSETKRLDLTLAPVEQSRAISLGMKVHPNLQLVIGGGFKLPELPILGSFWVMGEISPDTAHPLQSDVTLSLAKQF